MYEGGADVASRPSKPHQFNIDDDDVRSGNFNSTIKEQFDNATVKKVKVTGILKNPNPKEQEVSKKEEYQRKYDDYYQDVNNMIF